MFGGQPAAADDGRVEAQGADGALGEGAGEIEFAGTDLAAGKDEADPRCRTEFVGRLQGERQDGHPAITDRAGDLQGGGAGVQQDGFPVGEQRRHLGGDAPFDLRRLPLADSERRLLSAQQQTDRASAHPPDHTPLSEFVEVAADGHLGDRVLEGELGH